MNELILNHLEEQQKERDLQVKNLWQSIVQIIEEIDSSSTTYQKLMTELKKHLS